MSRRDSATGAGCRDKAVLIQQRPAADAVVTSGYPVDNWTTLVTELMERSAVTGDEAFKAEQSSSKYDTTWEMSYRTDMDPDLVDVPKLRRLLYSGRYFDIVSARAIGRKRSIELQTLASTRVAA